MKFKRSLWTCSFVYIIACRNVSVCEQSLENNSSSALYCCILNKSGLYCSILTQTNVIYITFTNSLWQSIGSHLCISGWTCDHGSQPIKSGAHFGGGGYVLLFDNRVYRFLNPSLSMCGNSWGREVSAQYTCPLRPGWSSLVQPEWGVSPWAAFSVRCRCHRCWCRCLLFQLMQVEVRQKALKATTRNRVPGPSQ